jgi:hypothetical protein
MKRVALAAAVAVLLLAPVARADDGGWQYGQWNGQPAVYPPPPPTLCDPTTDPGCDDATAAIADVLGR